jgi:hypothetical protein
VKSASRWFYYTGNLSSLYLIHTPNQAYTDYTRQIILTEIITSFVMSVRTSVCTPVCICEAPTRQIVVKSDTGEIKKTFQQAPNLVKIGKKIYGTSNEDLRTFTLPSEIDIFCCSIRVLHFHGKIEHLYIVDNYNNTKLKYCCVSIATVICQKLPHSYIIHTLLIVLYTL